jgi:hypothetical protein
MPLKPTTLAPQADAPSRITNSQNLRSIAMEYIVSNFEAYPALKQSVDKGVLAPTPCGSMFDPNIPPNSPCFSVASVATPNLRQETIASITIPLFCSSLSDSFFGFCDDLLDMWINTYFWFNHHGVGNPANNNEQPSYQRSSDLCWSSD